MKHRLKMTWRILRDKQVVVITEYHGRLYRNWDAISPEDVCLMCGETFDKAKEMWGKSKGQQGQKVAEPIPLTPEILKKNERKSINGKKYALKNKNANYLVLDFTEDGIYAYINERTMLFVIKYVHELKHLLFGLGINSEMEW